MATSRPHVVIVGAGFGGLWATKRLANKPVDVTLVDRNNYHSFFPLLYQVAAAELQPSDIAYPIRAIIRSFRNVGFRMGEVSDLDLTNRRLTVDDDLLTYDYLIMAPGSSTRFFGVEGAAEQAFGLRTLDDALRLRNHLLATFESAATTADSETRSRLLRYVIVGGGPTGVEFAGALQEFLNGPFRKDFPDLAAAAPQVVLVEAGDRLLGVYPQRLSAYAAKRLTKMGVHVRLSTAVAEVQARRCVTDSGEIPTDTVVWTAGVGGSDQFTSWGLPSGPADTVAVGPYLNVTDHPEVFVVGDISHHESGHGPMVCQNALQQGRTAADNILRRLRDQPPRTFEYRDLGNMAVIGRNAAVVHLWNRIALTGFLAWMIWLTLHLAKLVGFRNRLAALISWTGDYVFGDRVARLIIPSRNAQGGRSRR